jgi:hypothetical protein
MVAYSVLGWSNVKIANTLGFTPVHVSNVLNTDEGKDYAKKLHAKLKDNIDVDVPKVLNEAASQAAIRIKSAMFDDELYQRNPFAVIQAGMVLLKGVGNMKDRDVATPTQQTITNNIQVGAIINEGQRSDILDGLQKVAEVKRIHSGG